MAPRGVLHQGLQTPYSILQLYLAAAAGFPGSQMVRWGELFFVLYVFVCVKAHQFQAFTNYEFGTIKQLSAATLSTGAQKSKKCSGLVLEAKIPYLDEAIITIGAFGL